jgi:acetoin utilization deacetylase AcuC-like enzyme
MKVAFSKEYRYELPEGHRFPMEKYDLLPEQLIYEGTLTEENFFRPQVLTHDEILSVHDKSYFDHLLKLTLPKKEARKIGFPLSEALIARGRRIASGTYECVFHAMNDGVALNVAGGTHHAYPGHGEGFCVFNDIALASKLLLSRKQVKRILIVDLDVHQGNGNAYIFEKESRVFTFSMHGAKNYPLRKETSDLDIPLPDGTRDDEYLNILRDQLEKLINRHKPDIIFFQSGVDVLEVDKLGRLSMSKEGCKQRDEIVFDTCHRYQIPVIVTMGGCYATRVSDIIDAHANTYRVAAEIFGH